MNQATLNTMLNEHAIWISTNKAGGTQLNLSSSHMSSAHPELQGERLNLPKLPLPQSTARGQQELEGRTCHFNSLCFANADLRNAIIGDAVFIDCDFTKSNLRGCSLSEAVFSGCTFYNSAVAGIEANDNSITTFAGGYYLACSFEMMYLIDANLANSVFTKSSFKDCEMHAANFTGCNLGWCRFEECKMTEINFSNSICSEISFNDSHPVRADFSKSNLYSAYFNNVNLRDSNLKGAALSEANFNQSIMTGVSFSLAPYGKRLSNFYAWLRGRNSPAYYKGCQLNSAQCSEHVKRRISDAGYAEEFADEHPFIAILWMLASDCGRSLKLWALWSILVVLLFSTAYSSMDAILFHKELSAIEALYFSVVTFTTLGFGDITPKSELGMLLVVAQVVLGYIMLGKTLAIIAARILIK